MASPAISPDHKTLTLVLPDPQPPLASVAVELLRGELSARAGLSLVVSSTAAGLPPQADVLVLGTPGSNPLLEELAAGLPDPLRLPTPDPTAEGFVLRTLDLTGRRIVLGLAAGPRGLLWAACELLDAMWLAGDHSVLPDLQRSSAPRFTLRGLQYYTPRIGGDVAASLAPERVAEYKADIDFGLRRRMNLFTLGLDWPENLTGVVSYRYFPELASTVDPAALAPRAALVEDLVDYAADRGMDTYLSLTELFYPPELPRLHPEALATPPPYGTARWYRPPGSGFTSLASPDKLCPSHPVTRAFFVAKVRELAERFPRANGVELWVSHGISDIFYCDCPVCHPIPPHERLARLCHDALEALDAAHPQRDRRVLLRTYLGGWRQALEPDFYGPLEGCLSPRVIMGHKAQYGDMYYGNALHPVAGTFASHAEYVEFCLGGEYRAGLRWGVVAPVADDHVARRARDHARLGLAGVSFRHLPWRNRFNDLDFLVFGAVAWDPSAPVEPVWQRWAEERFGAAGPAMVELLRGCTEVMAKTLYAHGVSLTHWAVFPENLQRLRHLTMDRSAQATQDGFERLQPTPGNLAGLLAEKDAAIRRCGELIANLEELAPCLAPADHDALRRSLSIQLELGHLFRGMVECFWRYLIWERTLSEVRREWQRDELLVSLSAWRGCIAAARTRLSALYDPGLFQALGTRDSVWRSGIRPEGYYCENLEQIAADIEARLAVEPASVWGYYPRTADAVEP